MSRSSIFTHLFPKVFPLLHPSLKYLSLFFCRCIFFFHFHSSSFTHPDLQPIYLSTSFSLPPHAFHLHPSHTNISPSPFSFILPSLSNVFLPTPIYLPAFSFFLKFNLHSHLPVIYLNVLTKHFCYSFFPHLPPSPFSTLLPIILLRLIRFPFSSQSTVSPFNNWFCSIYFLTSSFTLPLLKTVYFPASPFLL